MSSLRARAIGLPLSRLSSFARSSRSRSIRPAIFRSSFERSAAGVRDQPGNARFAAATARSMSLASLSGTAARTSSVAGSRSSNEAPLAAGTNSLSMKLASRRKEFLRIELPPVDIGVPRVPRRNGLHPRAQIRRNHLRDDERFLAAQLVGIAELESEHTEDVARDVPGGLRVP